MTGLDALWLSVCDGDRRAFGYWMGRVERPIRRCLFPFGRAVDAESVVQETLLRMWVYAQERGAQLTGDDASLRFAIGMARNVARNMARKYGRELHLPPDEMPEPAVAPEPPPDPGLRRAIRECFEKLARKPLLAMQARLAGGHREDDATLAKRLGMTLNTFLQNIVRARQQLAKCLSASGVDLQQVTR
jgi:DNA-directed RNA polymerase specialized sigma24 family protein